MENNTIQCPFCLKESSGVFMSALAVWRLFYMEPIHNGMLP